MLDHTSFGCGESEFLDDSNPRIGGEAHLEDKGFPPKLDKWKTVPFTAEARTDLWTQGKTEMNFFRDKISSALVITGFDRCANHVFDVILFSVFDSLLLELSCPVRASIEVVEVRHAECCDSFCD